MTAEPTSWFHIGWVTFAPGTVTTLPEKCQMSIRSTALCHIPLSQNQKLTLSKDDLFRHCHRPGDEQLQKDHALNSFIYVTEHAKKLCNSNSSTLPLELVCGLAIPFSDRYTQSEPTWWCCPWDLHWEPTGVSVWGVTFGEFRSIFKSEYFDHYPQIWNFNLI